MKKMNALIEIKDVETLVEISCFKPIWLYIDDGLQHERTEWGKLCFGGVEIILYASSADILQILNRCREGYTFSKIVYKYECLEQQPMIAIFNLICVKDSREEAQLWVDESPHFRTWHEKMYIL